MYHHVGLYKCISNVISACTCVCVCVCVPWARAWAWLRRETNCPLPQSIAPSGTYRQPIREPETHNFWKSLKLMFSILRSKVLNWNLVFWYEDFDEIFGNASWRLKLVNPHLCTLHVLGKEGDWVMLSYDKFARIDIIPSLCLTCFVG